MGHIAKRYRRLQDTGQKIIDQVKAKLKGQKVADKIVSYYEDHSRALPKGKISKSCEFGVKLKVDMSAANGYITKHKLYLGNGADVGMPTESAESHAQVFKDKFKGRTADRSFYDKDIIENLEEEYKIALAIPHKKDRGKA